MTSESLPDTILRIQDSLKNILGYLDYFQKIQGQGKSLDRDQIDTVREWWLSQNKHIDSYLMKYFDALVAISSLPTPPPPPSSTSLISPFPSSITSPYLSGTSLVQSPSPGIYSSKSPLSAPTSSTPPASIMPSESKSSQVMQNEITAKCKEYVTEKRVESELQSLSKTYFSSEKEKIILASDVVPTLGHIVCTEYSTFSIFGPEQYFSGYSKTGKLKELMNSYLSGGMNFFVDTLISIVLHEAMKDVYFSKRREVMESDNIYRGILNESDLNSNIGMRYSAYMQLVVNPVDIKIPDEVYVPTRDDITIILGKFPLNEDGVTLDSVTSPNTRDGLARLAIFILNHNLRLSKEKQIEKATSLFRDKYSKYDDRYARQAIQDSPLLIIVLSILLNLINIIQASIISVGIQNVSFGTLVNAINTEGYGEMFYLPLT